MLDFNVLLEFSRSQCGMICAFVVPANLLATLQTLIFVGLQRSNRQVQGMAAIANLYALLMILHVTTWLVIGVIMAPTFILFSLGAVCFTLNSWAIVHPGSMTACLRTFTRTVVLRLRSAQTVPHT